jgi:hypothetical protein
LARIEAAAKQHISANIGEDRNDALTKVCNFLNRYFIVHIVLATSTMGC